MTTPDAAAPARRRVHVIACGVLALDLQSAIRRLQVDAALTLLPGGLHHQRLRPELICNRLGGSAELPSTLFLSHGAANGFSILGR